MKYKWKKRVGALLLCALVFGAKLPLRASAGAAAAPLTTPEDVRVASRLFELFFGEKKSEESKERKMLIPTGELFGIRMETDGVIVAEISPSTGASGLAVGDILLRVDGNRIESAKDLPSLLRGKESVTLTLRRGQNELTLVPKLKDGQLGVTVRDTVSGIGTVTYIDPDTCEFGGLGHGIADADSGRLTPMRRGVVTDVILGGVNRGAEGKPGELCGILRHESKGTLTQNHACGVFGKLNAVPEGKEAIPIAYKSEVREGKAQIITTVRSGKTATFDVSLSNIDYTSNETKSFTVHVDDPALVAITGGIVRGMSGSPIIQNGKLVGAVTHVMINDPTVGYGIFIENMLNAANMPMAKAS